MSFLSNLKDNYQDYQNGKKLDEEAGQARRDNILAGKIDPVQLELNLEPSE